MTEQKGTFKWLVNKDVLKGPRKDKGKLNGIQTDKHSEQTGKMRYL